MCDICKIKSSGIYKSTIHFSAYEPLNLKLCFKHDLELFKRGQVNFLKVYGKELKNLLDKSSPAENNFDSLEAGVS